MRDIKAIIEGIVSQGRQVGSGGSAFRSSSSSDSSGRHDHGIDIGAHRNQAHEVRAKDAAADRAKAREKEAEKRNKEAEQRRKETSKMANEENVDEARKPGRSLMDDPRVKKALLVHNVLQGKTAKPDSEKKEEPVKKESVSEGTFAKHETDHLKQMHARDSASISRLPSNAKYSHAGDTIDREYEIRKELKKRGHAVERPKHKLVIEDKMSSGTEARTKIKNVARMDDADPKSEKSTLGKTAQIKSKIIEEKPTMSLPNFGLPASLIAAARQIVEKKQDDDDKDPKKMKGGKTEVEINPETNDKTDDSDAEAKSKKKSVKEETKPHNTVPKTDKEKKLAALASPKDKITHKDVLVGRGVVKEEEVEQVDEVSKATLSSYVKKVAATPAGQVKPSREKGIEAASKKLRKEEVTLSAEEEARIAEIAKSFPAEIDEAVKKSKTVSSATTATSSPVRGANQDQSGFGTKSSTADYTISDETHQGYELKKRTKPDGRSSGPYQDLYHKDQRVGTVMGPFLEGTFKTRRKNQKGVFVHLIHNSKQDAVNHLIAKHKESIKEELELEEGRGRPRKNPLPAGQETEGDDTHKHPMQQLEKISHAIEGNEPHFEHKDGSKSKVGRHLARHIVAIHNSMRTSQEKDNFAQKVHANRDSMKAEVSKHI